MRQMKTCITKIIYISLLLSLAAIAAANLWSAQPKSEKATFSNIIVEIKKAEIKSQPTDNAGIIAVAFKGEIFKVLHELPGWYLLELSPGQEGYLAKKYARIRSAAKTQKIVTRTVKPILLKRETAEDFVLIVSAGSYIRTSPTDTSQILARTKINNAFRLIKKASSDWYEAALPTGKKCYIPTGIAKIITAAELSKLKEQWKTVSVSKAVPPPKPEPVVAPQPQPVSALYAVVIKNDVILRQEPNLTAKIMVAAKPGNNYKLISQEDNWSLVMLKEGQQAYVLTKVVKIVKEADLPAAIAEASKAAKEIKLKYVSVINKEARLRTKASDTAKVISLATPGTEFKLVWVYKGWYEVLTSSGTAFISDKSACLVNAAETGSQKPGRAPEPVPLKEKTATLKKPTEEIKNTRQIKPARNDEEAWLKDKYVLVTASHVNLRKVADKKSNIIARVNTGATFKLLARNKDWYEIFLPPDQNAFLAANLTEIITEAEVLAGPEKRQETKQLRAAAELKERQLRAATELKERQETAQKAKNASAEKARLAAEQKAKKEAEAKALKEAAEKARLENEKKTKEDATQRAKEAAELKASKEAQARAQEQEWLKDKYVLVKVKKAILQNKPNIKAKIIATVNIGDSYKLISRGKEWYEIDFSSGTAFLNANLGKILTESELAAQRQQEAEAKAQHEARAKARLENERKTKEDAEQRIKEAAELKASKEVLRQAQEAQEQAQKEAERKSKLAQEQEWLKDKYVMATAKNINLRKSPGKTAVIIAKTKIGESFKLVSRFKEWYEVRLSSGVAFIAANLADIVSEKELEVIRDIEKEATAEKANLLRAVTELAQRQKAEAKAKEELWCKDKYVVVITSNANLRLEPAKNAKILAKANKGDLFKLLDRGIEWYEIFLPPDQNAFVSISLVDILTEGEVESRIRRERESILRKQREAEALAKRKDAERLAVEEKAKKEVERKARELRAAEELRTRQEAELEARLENEKKIKGDSERRAKEAAELKAGEVREATELAKRQEAELKAKEIEWLKDKYVLITINNTNLRQAASKKAAIIAKTNVSENYKLAARTKDWYEINVSSGTAFVNANIVKVVAEQELAAMRQQQEKEKQAAAELQAKLKIAAAAKTAAYVEDKYILIIIDNTNIRTAPDKNTALITKAKTDESFKVTWINKDRQNNQWYQVSVTSGTQVLDGYIISTLAKLLTKQELEVYRFAQSQAIEKKARLEAKRKAKIEAEQKVREEAERRQRLEKQEAERKAKELRAATELAKRQAAEQKAKNEAEARAREQEWLKDKYVLIINPNTNIREAPTKNAGIISKAVPDQEYKLLSRSKNNEWYKIVFLTGTGFVNAVVVKLLSEQELTVLRQQQEQSRLETLKKETEAKSRRQAELQAKLETARKAAEEQVKQIEEARAKETAWLKDKYILVPDKNISLRTVPNRTANLLGQTRDSNESFKLLSRADRDWYQIQTSAGTAFIAVTVARVMSEQELNIFRLAEQQAKAEAELQAKLAAEEKARKEAETKAARAAEWKAKIEEEQMIREEKFKKEAAEKTRREIERQAKLEAERKAKELRAATELKERQESEVKARQTAEIKARLENESKAKMEAYVADKYVLVTGATADLKTAASIKAKNIARATAGESFKVSWIENEEWFRVITDNGRTAYLTAATAKLVTEKELDTLRETEAKVKLETELQAKEAAALKEKSAAEEKARKEAALIAKLESDRQAREEKRRQEAAAQSCQQAEHQARLKGEQKAKQEAELKAQEAAILKAKLEAEEKAKKEEALKARQEAEQKARAEAERKARESAKAQAKIEAEAKAKMEAYVKDKYIVMADNNAAVRTAPNILASVLYVAEKNESFKLQWVRDSWYEIKVPSGAVLATGFVDTTAAKSMTMKELAAWQKVQEQERLTREAEELKARQQAELKAKEFHAIVELAQRQETAPKAVAEKARLEAAQKAKAPEEKLFREEQARKETTAKARTEAEQKAKAEEEREDQSEYAYIIIKTSYAEIKAVPDLGAPALLIALKGDIFKYNGQQKGWYNILTFSGETRFVRKSLCRGSNITPQLVKDESRRRDIYDSIIDAKDRAMSEANAKYPSIKSQSELQEKIFYQQTAEEKFILEVFHKYRIQPVTYLTLLSEAISKNW
ncbi:MAG: hypothetical protein HY920_02110 [Elusimicrobia bacterium]|nr:hypothetical protein [Elusimicrobiota bacterium]